MPVALQVERHVCESGFAYAFRESVGISGCSARGNSSGAISIRASSPCARTRTCRKPNSRKTFSARSTRDNVSIVTGIPYGTREDKHADAGRSHVARPARRDSSRISALVRSSVEQRRNHAEFGRRAVAGAEIFQVIRIHAVCHGPKSPLARSLREHAK